MGAWTVCRFKGALGKKEGGGVLEGEVNNPIRTMPTLKFAKELEKLFEVMGMPIFS